jgi:hypothetical protein
MIWFSYYFDDCTKKITPAQKQQGYIRWGLKNRYGQHIKEFYTFLVAIAILLTMD